jgi:hypothetical protein
MVVELRGRGAGQTQSAKKIERKSAAALALREPGESLLTWMCPSLYFPIRWKEFPFCEIPLAITANSLKAET